MTLGDDGHAIERASAAYVSTNTFQVLGDRPVVGRDFVPQDDQPGAPAVVILGSRLWTTRYNADPSIVGRRVRVNGVPSTVIGVMPDGFRFPVVSDMWQPLAQLPGVTTQTRDTRQLQVFGRLALGIGVGLAGALAMGRLLQRFLIQTSPTDPTTLVGIAVLLAAVSFAAAFFPARRATGLDPLAALRYE
jgi:hypothetical protein